MQENKQPGLSWSTSGATAPGSPAQQPTEPAAPAPDTPKQILHTQAPIYAGLLVGGIIVGVLLATGWSSYRNSSTTGGTATTTQTQVVGQATSTGSTTATRPPLVVEDQPAGSSVKIDSLNIARPTWVVVYVGREGRPGNALGARLFFAGDKQGSVGLLRNTQAGQRYFVGLSVDNGDRTFSLTQDKPLADADGGPLWATFRAL